VLVFSFSLVSFQLVRMEFVFSLLSLVWWACYGLPFAVAKAVFPIAWPVTVLYVLRKVVFANVKYLSAQDSVLVSGDPDNLLAIHVATKLDRKVDPMSIRDRMLRR
jgi:hypothetical protein